MDPIENIIEEEKVVEGLIVNELKSSPASSRGNDGKAEEVNEISQPSAHHPIKLEEENTTVI